MVFGHLNILLYEEKKIYRAVHTRRNHTSSRRKFEIIKDLREGGKLLNNNLKTRALTGVTQLVECCPTKGKVAGLTPGQSTSLGCRPIPQLRPV